MAPRAAYTGNMLVQVMESVAARLSDAQTRFSSIDPNLDTPTQCAEAGVREVVGRVLFELNEFRQQYAHSNQIGHAQSDEVRQSVVLVRRHIDNLFVYQHERKPQRYPTQLQRLVERVSTSVPLSALRTPTGWAGLS